MTKAEVEAILGKASGGIPEGSEDTERYGRYGHNFWAFHDGTANVDWNKDGKVMAAQWKPAPKSRDRSILEVIRDLLRKIGV